MRVKRDAVFTIRLMQDEKDLIMRAASLVGMDGADFARALLLSAAKQIDSNNISDLPDILHSTGRLLVGLSRDTKHEAPAGITGKKDT